MSTTIPSALTDGLNEEQLKAVTMEGGNTLVLAGAGSGKTKVLATRIAWLIERGKATESSILAVTFTNKAAKEMKSRISKLTGKPLGKLWVGTFHGLCNQMLREFAEQIGIPQNFHIIDTDDQKSICKRLMKELKIEDYKPADAVDHINSIKEGVRKLGGDKILDDLFARYTLICEREGAMDFADLMHKTNVALSQNTGGIRDHYNARFNNILVDEFQDTNTEQFNWLKLLKAPTAEIFVVGDDDQSIYSFRGANPENMQNFIKGVRKENLIKLEQNYRSTSNILNSANSVIGDNSGRIGKTLRTSKSGGDLVSVCEFNNGYDESKYISDQAKELIKKGADPSDIAILYRSNHQSASIEKYLLQNNVPYIIYSGTRFFERKEIKDAVAYLRLALNAYDDSAFYRISNFPARGISAKVVDSIEMLVKTSEYETGMMQAASKMQSGHPGIASFVRLIETLDANMNSMSLSSSIVDMYERTGLFAHFEKDDEAEDRLSNLRELVTLAKLYEANEVKPGMNTKEQLIDFLSTFTLEDTKEQDANYGKKAVTLMTIHASKGLEFDSVFLAGAEEGSIPHKNSIGTDFLVEEERRLMYVAITRAKKNLIITHAAERSVYGQKSNQEVSRFVKDRLLSCDYVQVKSFANQRKNTYQSKTMADLMEASQPNPFKDESPRNRRVKF